MEFDRTTAAPAGDASTRERVVRSILENGPSTAVELAALLHLTPAAVRRHLDLLVADGMVVGREQKVYGHRGRGRPAKVFVLTDGGRHRFDQGYDTLAADALRYLRETGGEEAVLAFARRRASFIERDYAVITAREPDLSPAEALAKVFSAEGYAASVRQLPVVSAADQLCQQHCPVSHVAGEFPQLCEAETEAISQVLGTHVQRLATIALGDGVCTTCIPKKKEG
ncbi:helix-turn-helix transcriptional regulator [Nocardioides gilvus]|uniref:helix-turn-helix transcriptional regulator n=1 Tax=Nocardioides gilvus TaxID=1735589 RepID=UPI000D74741B|nr:metalloregulator ArsR/SmtB family transcription factor [Nocardioides gilvus]